VLIETKSGLGSVSCTSASFCMAVSFVGEFHTFDGNSWSGPSPVYESPLELESVSCPTSTFCVTVGTSGDAEIFDGSTWGPPSLVDPGFGDERTVGPIACPTTSFCMLVDGGGQAIEYNAGTWSAPLRPEGVVGGLGITCVSAFFCVAPNGEQLLTASAPPADLAPPTISGEAVDGRTLTESHGSWNAEVTGYTYQWESCDSAGTNCAVISAATSQIYTLGASDIGRTIRVLERATGPTGTSSPASSAPTTIVKAGGGQGAGNGGSGGTHAPTARVAWIRVRGASVVVRLSCSGSTGSTCTVTLLLTVHERFRGRRLVSVGASVAAAHHKRNRTAVVGRTTVTLPAGGGRSIRVGLNEAGDGWLRRRRALRVALSVN